MLTEESVLLTDVVLMNSVQLGSTEKDRIAVYDLYCTNQNGDHLVVEIQRVPQTFYIDRMMYYSSFLMQKQGVKGSGWNYELNSIFVISILNFSIHNELKRASLYYDKVKFLSVIDYKIISDKLTFVYLELPKFKKNVEQHSSHLDKWIWLFKHMEYLNEIPKPLMEPIFMKVLEKAKLEHLAAYELTEYETTLKTLRDNHNAMQYAIEKGHREGMQEGMKEGIQKGMQEGIQKGIQEGIQKGIQKGIEQGINQGKTLGEQEKAIKTAKIARSEGLSLEIISKLTELSMEELINIFKNEEH
jgi:predicted transposase/invertase (TIGR01784 family)